MDHLLGQSSPLQNNKKRPSSEDVGHHVSKKLRHAEPVDGVANTIPIKDDNQAHIISTADFQDEQSSHSLVIQPAAVEQTQDERPFRLMDLPAEIRVEIYRACLTRPFNILLSTKPPLKAETEASIERFAPLSRAGTTSGTHSWADPSRLRTRRPTGRSSRPTRASANSLRQIQATTQTRLAPIPRVPRITTLELTRELEHKEPRPQDQDPILVNLLQVSNLVYKEARPVLYAENTFELDIDTALYTLAQLHQRSRGQIRHMRLTINSHSEILERFAEVVRLSLRYCWRLQVLTINMPFLRPGATSTTGNSTVYANAFDILRWLPRQCQVVLEGNISDDIRSVVERNATLAKSLDEVQFSARFAHFISSHDIQLAYARRQAIATDNGSC